MRILFINGSPNKNGNTAKLAAELLKGRDYKTLNLTDYTIGAYGQDLPGDGLDEVIEAMKKGAAPEKWMLEAGNYTMNRFAGLYGMTYGGMVTSSAEAAKAGKTI